MPRLSFEDQGRDLFESAKFLKAVVDIYSGIQKQVKGIIRLQRDSQLEPFIITTKQRNSGRGLPIHIELKPFHILGICNL
jgi:hypothetical protein